ncbi:hypothetical protein QTG54_004196, partial [Skeletonema marinoi]
MRWASFAPELPPHPLHSLRAIDIFGRRYRKGSPRIAKSLLLIEGQWSSLDMGILHTGLPSHKGSDAAVNLTIRSNTLENVSPMVESCFSNDLPLNLL